MSDSRCAGVTCRPQKLQGKHTILLVLLCVLVLSSAGLAALATPLQGLRPGTTQSLMLEGDGVSADHDILTVYQQR